VALQGTLETFALPDVLRLLATTKKTGCYRLEGDRGAGRLFVRDGQVVAGDIASSPAVTDPREVAFELLRFEDGEFRFQADAMPPHETAPQDVESVLDAADQMLIEWRDIETIVPSLGTWVSLRPELPADEVVVRADKWVTIVAVGSGCTVGQLGHVLGLGELPVSRLVRDLLDLGVVELHEAAEQPATDGYGTAAPEYPQTYAERDYAAPEYPAETYEEPAYGGRPPYEQQYEEPAYEEPAYEEPAYEQPQPSYQNQSYEEPYEDPRYATAAYDNEAANSLESSHMDYGYGERGADGNVIEFNQYGDSNGGGYDNGSSYETYDPNALVMDDSRAPEAPAYGEDRFSANPPPPPAARTTVYEPTSYDTDPTDAAEIARQLANLSPRAAKAVAAAAKATTMAEREAALAQVDESEDSINRDLLLKFLGSVSS
jgi:hypothetical protein